MTLRRAAAFLLSCVLLCGCSAEVQPDILPSPPVFVPAAPSGTPSPYETVKVFCDGFLSNRAMLYSGEVLMPAVSLLSFFGIDAEVKCENDEFVLSADELILSGQSSDEYVQANGRYLYAPGGSFYDGKELWLPCEAMSGLLGIEMTASPELLRVDINTAGMNLICGGEDYYALNTDSEDIYWLSRIIFSEAANEPLAGLIGVGNVVLNRINSPDFPTTVFDVIFDRNHVVQFEPVINGSIYDEPDEASLIAAYLCLEGYNTVGESLYFVNPAKGGSWFDEQLQLVTVIGNHNFYA